MDTSVKPAVTPKDFFLWLAAMAALYTSVVSLLVLLFQYVDYLFPDVLQRGYYGVDPYSTAIRVSIACLVVVFPLYLVLTRVLNNSIRQNPEKRDLWVRRWALFLTLFVAGATITIDLITLIYTFLEGEITTRFVLKVLAILVVVGAGFLYYMYDLRGTWSKKEGTSKIIGLVTALLVFGTIIAGFFIIGSPAERRLERFDAQKVSDLQSIQWQLVSYWQQKEKLPATLDELQDPISSFMVPLDPQTKGSYEYRVTGDRAFELCATFNAPLPQASAMFGDTSLGSWQHDEGRTCFTRTIDPDRYPPLSNKTIPRGI